MSPTLILFLQSILISGQVINASIGTVTHNATAVLIVGAVLGGFQFFMQHIGNQTVPPPKSP
jgi:hypothetical protein